MITLKQWMELVDYQITEGSDYHLNGETLFALTSWNGRQADGGYSVQIVFDPKTQVVYHVEACDYQRNRAYSLNNPDHTGIEYDKTAWDDTKWTDLEVDNDFIEKASAIIAGQDYDTRVSITLDLPDDLLFKIMIMAHEADITLNEFVVKILSAVIDRHKKDETGESTVPSANFLD
jgi:hypothetical protein